MSSASAPVQAALTSPTLPSALGRPDMTLAEHFRRDHFPPPQPAAWRVTVDGCVAEPLHLGYRELQSLARGRRREIRCVLQCAGNRRAEQTPTPDGVPWQADALGEIRWSGVPLAVLLERAGVLPQTTAIVLEGADHGVVTTGAVEPFARALPLAKALDPDVLLADGAADELLPHDRGGPVRAIVPGWYATDSVKWIRRITAIDVPFAGHFEARDYRLAPLHAAAGSGRRMTDLPVQAQITSHRDHEEITAGPCVLTGIAWGGSVPVGGVELRVGDELRLADLGPDRGRYARRMWRCDWDAAPGRHVVQVRAIDAAGRRQPTRHTPTRKGYGNASAHRITLHATAAPSARHASGAHA